MTRPLFKHTIVIWSEDGTRENLEDIAREANHGNAYCAAYNVKQVDVPENDPDWDGTEFFGVDEDDENDENDEDDD